MANTSENVSSRQPWIHSAPALQDSPVCGPPRAEETSFRGCFDRANKGSIESASEISASKPGGHPPVVLVDLKDAGEQLVKQEVACHPTTTKEGVKEGAEDDLSDRGDATSQATYCELREQNSSINSSGHGRTADVDAINIERDQVTPVDLLFPKEKYDIQPRNDDRSTTVVEVIEPPREGSLVAANGEGSSSALHTVEQVGRITGDTQQCSSKISECQLDPGHCLAEMEKEEVLLQMPSAQTTTSTRQQEEGDFHGIIETALRQSNAERVADKEVARAFGAREKETTTTVLQVPAAHPNARNDEDFHGLIEAAMRKSDAERSADKEAVRAFRALQPTAPFQQTDPHPASRNNPSSTPKQQVSPVVSPTKPAALLHPETLATSSSARDRCDGSGHERGGIEPVVVGSAATAIVEAASTDVSSTPALHPIGEPTTPLSEERWVRYVSPEGYPYLYNAVTGDSQWVVVESEEEEEGACDTIEVASGSAAGKWYDEQGRVCNNQKGRADVNGGVGTANKGTGKAMDEAESVDTCAVSQSSQGASGTDFR